MISKKISIKFFTALFLITFFALETFAQNSELLKLAESGDAKSQLALAAELIKTGDSKSIEDGVEWLKKSAANGCLPAQNWLGVIYGEGRYAPRNLDEAVKWRESAALGGTVVDKWALGNAFLLGYFLPKDLTKGIHWIEESAKDGYRPAVEKSAEIREKLGDLDKAREWKNKLAQLDFEDAKKGNSAAMLSCSTRFLKGKDGFKKSLAEGIYWLKKAADGGNREAQEKLASFYIRGRYVSKNIDEGIALYETLAKANPSFYAQLATIFETGKDGVAVDKKRARSYLEKYAELGVLSATGSTRAYLAWLYWRDNDTNNALLWSEKYIATLPEKAEQKRTGAANVARKIADGLPAPEEFSKFMEELSGLPKK